MTFNQAIEENILNDKPVFEIDGIKYYQFLSNGAKISKARLLAFSDIINEHSKFSMRKEDLNQEMSFLTGDFQRVMNNVGNTKELNEIATNGLARITSIKQRMSLGFNFERIFDVSALWFIREGENPSKVDAQITAEKKAHFIKHPELNDFFLTFTENIWNPFPTLLDKDFLEFTREDVQLQRLANLATLSNIASNELTPEQKTYLRLRVETLTNLLDYLKVVQKTFTTS